MNNDSSNQIPLGTGNNSTKIYLGDIRSPVLHSFARPFKVDKETAKKNGGRIWLNPEFKTDFEHDEMRAKSFELYVQGTDTITGMRIEITESILQELLDTMKEIKSNVYCMDEAMKKTPGVEGSQ